MSYPDKRTYKERQEYKLQKEKLYTTLKKNYI